VAGTAVPPSRPPSGFTLIELLVVLAITAVLATIAIPTYADHLRRGRITEALARLADHRVRMEQFFPRPSPLRRRCRPMRSRAAAGRRGRRLCARLHRGVHALRRARHRREARGMHGFVYTIDQANARSTPPSRTAGSAATAAGSCAVTAVAGRAAMAIATQRGALLLDALAAIAVVAIGVLGCVTLQAHAIRHVHAGPLPQRSRAPGAGARGPDAGEDPAALAARYDARPAAPGTPPSRAWRCACPAPATPATPRSCAWNRAPRRGAAG